MRALGNRQSVAEDYVSLLDRRAHAVRTLLMSRYPGAGLERILSVEHQSVHVLLGAVRVHASLPWSDLVQQVEDAATPWIVMES